jgi:hypothetical protein
MCAIDALGIPPMLGTDAVIRSGDSRTGRPVTVTFHDGTASWDPATAVVLLPGVDCGGPAVDACCAAVSFLAEQPRRPGGRVLGQAARVEEDVATEREMPPGRPQCRRVPK